MALGLWNTRTQFHHQREKEWRQYKVISGQKGIQGWGLLSQFPPFNYFPNFSSLSKHSLAVIHCIYIWQVSPQLSCGDTCEIWMWFEEYNMCFCNIENFAYGKINERSFSNLHPWHPIKSIQQEGMQSIYNDISWLIKCKSKHMH